MSFNHEQSRQLFGIGPLSGRGTKRAAESTASLSHPYGGIQNTDVWKKPQPTPINTISTMNDRRPKHVHNPYAAATSSERNSNTFIGNNPTASKTVTDSRIQKRRKFELDRPSSKYWSGQSTRAVPSMVRPGINVTQPDAGPSRKPGQETSRNSAMAPPSTNWRANPTEVISIDESESEIDKGVGNVTPHSLLVSDNDDEIVPSTQSPDEYLLVGSSHATVKTRSRGKREISPNHPFKRPSPALRVSSDLSAQARHIVEDGESTKSLKNRLRNQVQRVAIDLPSSPLSSPPPVEDVNMKDDEVEEIEDADMFSDMPTVMPRASSSKDRAMPQAEKSLSAQDIDPSMSGTKEGRAKQVTEELEESRKIPTNFIADLTLHGIQKSRKQKSLIGAMKKRNPATAQTSSRGRMRSKANGISSRDSRATAQTKYGSSRVVLPLDSWSWGTRKEVASDKKSPDYWFYWDDGDKELQVVKHPLGDLETGKKSAASLKRTLLKGSEITISDDNDFHIVRIQFDEDCDGIIPDDVANEGMSFLFMAGHPNMADWGQIHSRLKNLAAGNGRELRRVVGAGAKACFQSAMKSVDTVETRTQQQPDETADASASSSVVLAMANKEADTSARKKRQPRPRPAHAGRNQNIAEMFTESSTRRSSRLLVEAFKKDQEPPANLDEIILVYPPSGQGAINITSGDLRRLEPSEFLNDTLIELGLKFWLNELRNHQPELAESIHVFSSFFFKKLANKNNKTPEDGHKSVRKWTTKVDIFKKKYIIVPINENIHWYLAIIYHPEHILEPSLPKPLLRTSKRISNAASNKDVSLTEKSPMETMIGTEPRGSSIDTSPRDLATGSTTSKENDSEAEAQVEKELVDDADLSVEKSFRSCSLDELQTSHDVSAEVLSGDESKPIYPEEDEFFSHSYEVEDHDSSMDKKCFSSGKALANSDVVADSLSEDTDDTEEIDQLDEDEEPPSYTDDIYATMPPPSLSETSKATTNDAGDDLMDVDDTPIDASRSFPAESPDISYVGVSEQHMIEDEAGLGSKMDKEQIEMISTIPADNFYARPNKRIKTYEDHQRSMADAVPNQNDEGSEGDELNILADHKAGRESSEALEVTERPRTIIFSLDSLGSTHPKALSRLNEYLQEEAKDKKGVENPGSALTKKAAVPSQPNYCDCGLYLLHFAQTFMRDPQRYKEAIFADRKSSAAINPRELWRHDQVGSMRESLKTRILEESEKWKKLKAEKEQKSLDSKRAVGDGEAGQPAQPEESDDEIEVSEVRLVGPSPKKQTKKAPSTPAARLR